MVWPFRARSRRSLYASILAIVWLASGTTEASEPLKADRILVLKSKRELQLLYQGKVVKTYIIALGAQPLGPKRRAGDGRTPEGTYTIDRRLRQSAYHRALHLSYPSEEDRAASLAAHVSPGDGIFIHGMPNYFGRTDPVRFFRDWTNGCIAVGNLAIETIWDAVPDGTPVEIRP